MIQPQQESPVTHDNDKSHRQRCLAERAPSAQQQEAGDSARCCALPGQSDEIEAPAGEWEMAE